MLLSGLHLRPREARLGRESRQTGSRASARDTHGHLRPSEIAQSILGLGLWWANLFGPARRSWPVARPPSDYAKTNLLGLRQANLFGPSEGQQVCCPPRTSAPLLAKTHVQGLKPEIEPWTPSFVGMASSHPSYTISLLYEASVIYKEESKRLPALHHRKILERLVMAPSTVYKSAGYPSLKGPKGRSFQNRLSLCKINYYLFSKKKFAAPKQHIPSDLIIFHPSVMCLG